MDKGDKYLNRFKKIMNIIGSCKTPEHIDATVTIITRFNDLYPNLNGDILINFLYKKMEEILNGKESFKKDI